MDRTMRLVAVLGAFLVSGVGVFGGAGDGMIPVLAWEPRSDWVSVRDLGAVGDGVADDTEAIRKGLAGIGVGSTLYFPPGTYRVTGTLELHGPLVGVALIGHGRETRLVWDGAEGGTLFLDDGVAYSRFIGLVFDGRDRAAVGFRHASDNRFETEVRHSHLAFLGFTDAAVLRDPKAKFSTAETLFENCLFERCRRGVAFVSFNDYNYTFDGCEFRDCGVGVDCSHGNFYVRNCRFERSTEVDIHARPEHGSSVRRTVSVGSKAFVRFANSVSPLMLQDCRVSGWTGGEGACITGGAPVTLVDCVFSDGPEGQSPVQLRRGDQPLILSGNRTDAGVPLLPRPEAGNRRVIPAGDRGGALRSAEHRFLRSTVPAPGRVFDAKRDFGAAGDGKSDDTAALQAAIDAAREAGGRALAYLPAGTYVVSETLRVTGGGYGFGGCGWGTRLVWRGVEGGTMVSVRAVGELTLEHMNVGSHDAGEMRNGIDIEQVGSGESARVTYDGVFVYGMYQKQPFRKGLHLRGLGADDIVVMPHVQGNVRVIESARATILGNCTYEGSIVVEGDDPERDGFLGFQTRLATLVSHGLYLRGNHGIVMSDFYVEQADNGFVFEGRPDDPPGGVTIGAPKIHFTVPADNPQLGSAVEIAGYAGEITFLPAQFYIEPKGVRIRGAAGESLRLNLAGSCFYGTHPEPAVDGEFRLGCFGNDAVIPTPDDTAPGDRTTVVDNLTEDEVKGLSRTLDRLRRLGEIDLRLNHPGIVE